MEVVKNIANILFAKSIFFAKCKIKKAICLQLVTSTKCLFHEVVVGDKINLFQKEVVLTVECVVI